MNTSVPGALAGERLDRIVALVAGLTRAQAGMYVDDGLVRVNDRVERHRSRRLLEGDVIELSVSAPASVPPIVPDDTVAYSVVHADADVIVIDKPAGVVVHPGAGNPSATLVNGLLAQFPDLMALTSDPRTAERPGIVHRLDKGTSGLLVVGRSASSVASLQAQLADRSMHRSYIALAWGRFSARRGVVDAPIGRNPDDPTQMAIVANGRPARTHYVVERSFERPEPTALLRCDLESGRTHQIRVHLRSIGHSVVGDSRYGGARATIRPGRPFLHAAHLRFVHPRTGQPVEFEAALPDDLSAVLAALE